MPRRLPLLPLALALLALPSLATAFPATDAFGTGFSTLSDSQRREVTGRVVPLLEQAGVTRLRLSFGWNDTPFAWGDIEAHLDDPRLYTLDDLIARLLESGIEPEIVLSAANAGDHGPSTLLPMDVAAWKQFVKLVVERYDGDLDFAVNGCDSANGPYPNIDASDGSTECSSYDYHSAPDSERQAWADAHRVHTYYLEDAPWDLMAQNAVPVEQYGQLVALTVPWMRSLVPADFDLRVVLGGVRFAAANRLPFVQALAPLAAADATSRPDAADVFAVVDEGAGLTGEPYQDAAYGAKSFSDWLTSAGLKDLPFQVGRVTASAGLTDAFPWENVAGPKGTCHGRFCSERSQVESLVKGLTRLAWKHPGPAFVANVLEYVGTGEFDAAWAWHGLYVERGDSPITGAEVTARPAGTALAWLHEQAPSLWGGSVTEVFPVPSNTYAFRLDDAPSPTWIAWYDWAREVPSGQDWLGITKNLDLVDVPTTAVRVTPLMPEAGAPWTAGPAKAVTDGVVRLELAREVLLIQGVDEAEADEASTPEVVEVVDVTDEVSGADDAIDEGSGGGGCALAGPSAAADAAWLLLSALVLLRTRARRPHAR